MQTANFSIREKVGVQNIGHYLGEARDLLCPFSTNSTFRNFGNLWSLLRTLSFPTDLDMNNNSINRYHIITPVSMSYLPASSSRTSVASTSYTNNRLLYTAEETEADSAQVSSPGLAPDKGHSKLRGDAVDKLIQYQEHSGIDLNNNRQLVTTVINKVFHCNSRPRPLSIALLHL